MNSLGFKNLLNFYKYSNFVIGNSSSGIGQAPYFRIPTINIGERQKGDIFTRVLLIVDILLIKLKMQFKKLQNKNFFKKLKKNEIHVRRWNSAKKLLES